MHQGRALAVRCRAEESRLTQVGEHGQAPLSVIHINKPEKNKLSRRKIQGVKTGLFLSLKYELRRAKEPCQAIEGVTQV